MKRWHCKQEYTIDENQNWKYNITDIKYFSPSTELPFDQNSKQEVEFI